MATDLRQTHFRFGKDDGTEASHTFWQLEDVNHSQFITTDWTFLLRFTEQESGGTAAANTDAQFQYNKNGAGWVDITTTSSVVKAVAVGAFTNGQVCTKRLSGTGTFETSGAGCTEDGSSGGTTNDIVASGNSETEAGLQVVFANVANNDTIQFRFTSPDWTVTYTITPTLTITVPVNTTVTPGTLALATVLYTPSVILGTVVVLGVAALVLTAYIPEVTVAGGGTTVTPGTASLVTTRFSPSVVVNTIVIPGTVALTTTRFTPSVILGTVVVPTTVALTTIRYTPAVSISNNVLVTPGTVSLIVTRYTPLVIVLSYTSYALPFLYESANWSGAAFYLEAYIRATAGTVYARLWNETTSQVVTDSELSTTNSSFQRLRSGALTLTNNNLYRLQFGKAGADAGEFLGGKLVIV